MSRQFLSPWELFEGGGELISQKFLQGGWFFEGRTYLKAGAFVFCGINGISEKYSCCFPTTALLRHIVKALLSPPLYLSPLFFALSHLTDINY